MTVRDCIFCEIVAGQVPSIKIYENDSVLAFMDVGPISEGHTLVIPKRHFEKLDECPAEILSDISIVLGRVAKAVSQVMASDGYNVLCNNGRAAGQLVEHVHFHIIPRKKDDGVFSKWPSFEYEQGRAEEIAGKICAKL